MYPNLTLTTAVTIASKLSKTPYLQQLVPIIYHGIVDTFHNTLFILYKLYHNVKSG